MVTVSLTELYDILSAKLGKEEAKSLVTYVEEKVEKEVESKTAHLATKEDLEKGFKEQNKSMLIALLAIVGMILGIYAMLITVIIKIPAPTLSAQALPMQTTTRVDTVYLTPKK